MNISFAYNPENDKRCWQRLIEAGELFGKTFPKQIEISHADKERAKNVVHQFQIWWDESSECDEGLRKIYGYSPPASMMVYVNTSSYSMDDTERGWISLSMMRDTQEKVRTTVIHELGHVMFRQYWADYCATLGCSQGDIENTKEIVTVIHNVVFDGVQDDGYHVHTELRKRALEVWNQTGQLKDVIQEIKRDVHSR